MEELWRRVSQGQHAAVLGASWARSPGRDGRGDASAVPWPPLGTTLRVVRVSCDVPQTPLGPLLDARRKVDDLLGESDHFIDQAKERVISGLRRRLLGEVSTVGVEGGFVEACNRLARHSERPHALFFDAVDAADVATLTTLARVLRRSGWLRLPIILSFRSSEPTGSAAQLLDALQSSCGADAVLRFDSQLPPQTAPVLPWRELPPDVLEVLRVGSMIGSGFEADLVAAVLGLDPLRVLELIQIAFDMGVAVEDRGEGRFHLPERYIRELCSSILPSLSLAWHRRIAEVLGGSVRLPPRSRRPVAVAAVADEPQGRERTPGPGAVESAPRTEPAVPRALGRSEPAAAPGEGLGSPDDEHKAAGPAQWAYVDLYEAAREAAPDAPLAAPENTGRAITPGPVSDVPSTASWIEAGGADDAGAITARSQSRGKAGGAGFGESRTGAETHSPPVHSKSEARAASHLDAAGDADAAAQRYYAAASQAAAVGASPQAVAYAQRALSLLEGQPVTSARRLLRIQILSELGRLMWQAAGPDGSFTLTGALEMLDAGKALLREGDSAELGTQVSSLIASVCYDIGDPSSLDRALAELTEASRALLAVGNAVGAARLLNDQAAVYVRMGDPLRAVHLLGESRKVFEQRAKSDPVTMIELAETDHLFARIPLNVGARPGREADALGMGLDHALAAERTYKKLGAVRETARVWETIARLELRRGRLDNAMERLSAAMRAQQSLGDVIGLARSTAAMAEVLAAAGRMRESITLLNDSVAFNLEKGSPIGLAYNRRALDSLAAVASQPPDVRQAVSELSRDVAKAEAILGHIKLPGESS